MYSFWIVRSDSLDTLTCTDSALFWRYPGGTKTVNSHHLACLSTLLPTVNKTFRSLRSRKSTYMDSLTLATTEAKCEHSSQHTVCELPSSYNCAKTGSRPRYQQHSTAFICTGTLVGPISCPPSKIVRTMLICKVHYRIRSAFGRTNRIDVQRWY